MRILTRMSFRALLLREESAPLLLVRATTRAQLGSIFCIWESAPAFRDIPKIAFGISHKILGFLLGYPEANHKTGAPNDPDFGLLGWKMLGSRVFNIFCGGVAVSVGC